MNSAPFFAPYTSSLTLTRGTGVTTHTRATDQTFTDHEGVLRTAPSGVIAVEGGRMVRNLLAGTTTLATQNVTTVAGDYTLSFSGTGSVALSGTVTDNLAGTGANDRVQKTVTATAGTLTLTVTGSVTSAQLEDVTGQSIQTAGEYVSVGVLSDPWHGAGADGVQFFDTDLSGNPLTPDGIAIWPAATNLFTYSQDTTNAAWAKDANASVAINAVAPDGTTTGTTVTQAVAGAFSIYRAAAVSDCTVTNTVSIFVKAGTLPTITFRMNRFGDGTNYVEVPITTATGALGAVVNAGNASGGSATTKAAGNGWYRITLSGIASATAGGIGIGISVAATGTFLMWQGDAVVGALAGPPIPTTTAAVARNAGILSTPTSGNITAAAGTIAFEFTPGHASSGTVYLWGSYVDANNGTYLLHDATNLIFRQRIAGVDTDATIALAFVSGTTYSGAFAWGADGQKIAVDATLGTPHANTTAAQIAATMQLGSDGNGANQAGMAFKMNYILQRQASDSEMVAMTA